MDLQTQRLMAAAAGAGSDPIGVEDVFKTYVYKGNGDGTGNAGTSKTINNGINLSGEGGMLWIKSRSNAINSFVADTERGVSSRLRSNDDTAAATAANCIASFNNNGFGLGTDGLWTVNHNNYEYASWTFRKQKKFFDIVTWTGDGATNRTINHGLGSIPGCIIIKRTDAAGTWIVYHRGLADGSGAAWEYAMQGLDSNGAKVNYNWLFKSAPTATSFEVGSGDYVNYNTGGTQGQYVAYLFAHEEAAFGPDSDQKIISCGSYTGNGSATGPNINLGFESQWIMIKNTSSSGNGWMMYDTMRGWFNNANDDLYIMANSTNAEAAFDLGHPTSTGFEITTDNSSFNASGDTYIYIAIAAETGKTMKAIATGSDVFAMDTGAATGVIPDFDSGFPVDFALVKHVSNTDSWYTGARLTGQEYMATSASTQGYDTGSWVWDSNVGWIKASGFNSSVQSWMWKRHAGFDVICYKGNGTAGRQITHNLSETPEMIWVKKRNDSSNWTVYNKGLNGGTNPEQYYIHLDETTAENSASDKWNNTAPTSTHFTIGNSNSVNENTHTFIAMLFASVDGVSKLGKFTGSASTVTLNLGFQPRLLIVKSSTTGGGHQGWYVFDTTRGWGSGNDSYIRLEVNSAAGTFDVGAPTATGCTIIGDNDWNKSGSEFIYYAHA